MLFAFIYMVYNMNALHARWQQNGMGENLDDEESEIKWKKKNSNKTQIKIENNHHCGRTSILSYIFVLIILSTRYAF